IERALCPAHFYVRPDLPLVWQPPATEEIRWEVFRGRPLDPAHTRQTRRFLAWNIALLGQESAGKPEPLLSVKLDEELNQIQMVRAILAHVWVGHSAGGNVIESREEKRWVRELVGTLCLADFSAEADLEIELSELLRAAVEGTSRLPLNSVETP